VPDVLIELGDTWSAPAPEEARPPRRRRDPRPWLLLLTLAPVLVLGGAAGPPSLFREVASAPVDGVQVFAVTADSIEVVEQSEVDASTVASYPLSGGGRRWVTRVLGPVDDLLPEPAAGVLLAINLGPGGVGRPVGGVSALDAGTGRLLWSRPGAHLVQVRLDQRRAVLYHGRGPVATAVTAVDLGTGTPVWTTPLEQPGVPWAAVAVPTPGTGSPPGPVLALVGDTVMALDAASGAVLASRRVGIPSAEERHDARAPRLYILGGQGIVAYEERFHTVFAAYDLAALTPRWRTTMPTETGFLAGCGPVICAGTGILSTCFPVRCSEIDSFLYGLDPGSAAQRWVSRGWSRTGAVLGAGTRVVAFNREPVGSLLARAGVIDPATGELAVDLSTWTPVDPAPGTPTVLVASQQDSYHSWFALLRADLGRIVPVGRLPVAGEACQTAGVHLVCPTLDGRLTVWRFAEP
jgi:outer membrane protein assembly factor BamB